MESGQFIPEEIKKKLEQKSNRTPQEEEILQKEKQMQSRKEKVRYINELRLSCGPLKNPYLQARYLLS